MGKKYDEVLKRLKAVEERVEKLDSHSHWHDLHEPTFKPDKAERMTATETMMAQDHNRWRKNFKEQHELYLWLNGKSNKRPAIADRVLGRLTSPNKPECKKCAQIEEIFLKRVHGNMPDCNCGACPEIQDIIWPDKPECIITSEQMRQAFKPDKPGRVCDKCGGKFGNTCHHMGISRKPDPALPLRVRVAKLIDWDVPNKLTLEWAMGALEQYCRKHQLGLNNIGFFPLAGDKNKNWCVELGVGYKKTIGGPTSSASQSLPTAISLAIVTHSENKKRDSH